jgi:hypothetical protein
LYTCILFEIKKNKHLLRENKWYLSGHSDH